MHPRSSYPARFIQVFNRYLFPGGEENSVARIADHLTLGGHEVERFWRASSEWTGPHAPSKLRQPLLLWHNPAVLKELAALHERVKPNAWILHNVLPVVSLGVYRLALRLKVPIIQWLHNYRPISPSGTLRAGRQSLNADDPWLPLKEIWAGTWHGRALTAWLAFGYARLRRRGDFDAVRAWVAVSEEMRSIFLRAGWPASRLHVLRHSWDIQDVGESELDAGYFLFLGRMVEEKGVRFLIELWKDSELRSIPLVMAGQGPLADELSRNSPPGVRWVGHVIGEKKRELVQGCRAILFPALWHEPLSTVAYEAYQARKPIIASNTGGMKEIIHDCETGRLLPAGDAVEWKKGVLQLASDRELAGRLGRAGRQWLETNASPGAWNRQFDDILRRLLDR